MTFIFVFSTCTLIIHQWSYWISSSLIVSWTRWLPGFFSALKILNLVHKTLYQEVSPVSRIVSDAEPLLVHNVLVSQVGHQPPKRSGCWLTEVLAHILLLNILSLLQSLHLSYLIQKPPPKGYFPNSLWEHSTLHHKTLSIVSLHISLYSYVVSLIISYFITGLWIPWGQEIFYITLQIFTRRQFLVQRIFMCFHLNKWLKESLSSFSPIC